MASEYEKYLMAENERKKSLGNNLVNAGLGWYQGKVGQDATEANLGIARDSNAQRQGAWNSYAAQLQGLAPSVAAGYTPRGATVNTGLATGVADPNSGTMSATLDPRAKGLFDKYLQGATAQIGQAGGFDPRALGQERFNAQQALLAPQRAKQQADMMRNLQAKGLLGSGTYNSGLPGEGASNPFMAALSGANAQADAQLAARSLDEGENYLDRLMKRSSGLFGAAQTVDQAGQGAMNAAGDWSQRLSNADARKTDATTGLFKEAFGAQRNAQMPSADVDRARAEEEKANAARRGGIAEGAAGIGRSILGNPSQLSGMFSGLSSAGNTLGNMFAGAKDWFSGLFNTSARKTPFDGWYTGGLSGSGQGWTNGYDL
jgi:hypothetical protein